MSTDVSGHIGTGGRDLIGTRLVRHWLSMQLRKSQIGVSVVLNIEINMLDKRQKLGHPAAAVLKIWLGILLEHLAEAAAA